MKLFFILNEVGLVTFGTLCMLFVRSIQFPRNYCDDTHIALYAIFARIKTQFTKCFLIFLKDYTYLRQVKIDIFKTYLNRIFAFHLRWTKGLLEFLKVFLEKCCGLKELFLENC